MLESRHGDLREQNLNRQGKGHFHVSGMGHEALAAISFQMEPDDYIVPYYRDRALVLGRGVTSRELALEYFAKRKGQSGGRQMPSHYSYADRHIWSVPTPTGSQLLPACGIAWGIKLDGKTELRRHDRRRRRDAPGRFFRGGLFREREASCRCCSWSRTTPTASAVRRGRSIRSRSMFFSLTTGTTIDGNDVQTVYDVAAEAIEGLRAGKGPGLFLGEDGTAFQPHQLRRSETLSQRGGTRRTSRKAIRSSAGKSS